MSEHIYQKEDIHMNIKKHKKLFMRQSFDLDMRNLSRLSLARNTIDNAVTVRKMGHTKLFYDF